MSMSMSQWVFALAGVVGPLFLLWVMLRRNLRKQYPFFFKYLIAYVAVCAVGIAAYLFSGDAYFYAYWILTIALMAIELCVIYEVLANTLKSYSALVDLAKILFQWAALFLFLMALITALATTGAQTTKMEAAMSVVDRSIRLMQCGLLLFLLVFETKLGVSWRNYGMSIAIGTGVYAAADLSITYLKVLSIGSCAVLDTIGGLTYIAIVGFWGCVLTMREPAPKSILDTPSRLIFQRWNEALMSTPLIARKAQAAFAPVESFLPGVEQTVERVMARKMMH